MCKKLSHIVRVCRHTHTHTRLTALCPGLPGWVDTRKVKPTWILLKQQTMSGNGISWAICKSAPRSRQITMPAPHHSVFFTGRTPFLPPNQQHQSTEGTQLQLINKEALLLRQKAEPWQWQRNDMINQSVCYAVQQRRTEEMHLKFSMNISNIQRTVESRWRHGQTTHRCCWYL